MATPPTESDNISGNGQDILTPQIEERIVKIRRHWATLREEWDSEELINIHSALSELSEYASHEASHSLSDAAFAAEVYLSSFVGTHIPMTPNQREAVDSLLAELTADHQFSSDRESPKSTPLSSEEIFLLGPMKGPLQIVAELLAEQGLKCITVGNTAEIESAMRSTLPAAIVADIRSVSAIETLLEKLAHLRKASGEHIPMVYVSENDNLEMRIRAIRASGAAFFSAPFDGQILARKLSELKRRGEPTPNRILIIEDDVAQAEFSSSILLKAGFETAIVTDPMQTLERLREFAPDLIIMDIYMPEVDGIELTSVIREYNEYAGIPIIFLSGEQDTDRQVDALSVGGDDFVTKPIRPKHLIAIVKNRIRRSVLPRQTRAVTQGVNLLTKNQLLERLTTLLSNESHRDSCATAVLLLTSRHAQQIVEGGDQDALQKLLTLSAKALSRKLGDKDSIAQLDATTLAIAARRDDNLEIHDLVATLHDTLKSHDFQLQYDNQPLKFVIGFAFASAEEHDANAILRKAQSALEHVKMDPSAETISFDSSWNEGGETTEPAASGEDDLAQTINNCLEENAFVVLFQPLLDLQARGSENYEITLRVPTSKGELLTPDEFHPGAVQAGLAEDIDKWLIVHALKQLKERQGHANETRFFLRQSGNAILDPDFPEWLASELRKNQVVGTGLVMDFPLASLSHDLKSAKTLVGALHKMDIRICISQFPEKSAAFKLLRYVRGDYIRIAKRLLKSDRQTIMTVVNEAHSAKAKVIISHIDDPRAIDLHWSSGGDLLQGDFIQPPIDNLDYDFSQVVI